MNRISFFKERGSDGSMKTNMAFETVEEAERGIIGARYKVKEKPTYLNIFCREKSFDVSEEMVIFDVLLKHGIVSKERMKNFFRSGNGLINIVLKADFSAAMNAAVELSELPMFNKTFAVQITDEKPESVKNMPYNEGV